MHPEIEPENWMDLLRALTLMADTEVDRDDPHSSHRFFSTEKKYGILFLEVNIECAGPAFFFRMDALCSFVLALASSIRLIASSSCRPSRIRLARVIEELRGASSASSRAISSM